MGRRIACISLFVGLVAAGGCLESPAPSASAEASEDAESGCSSPEECSVGLQCINESCVRPPPCETNEDCPGGRTCVRGGCYTNPGNAPPPDTTDGDVSEVADTGDVDSEAGLTDADATSADGDGGVGETGLDADASSGEQNCGDNADNDGDGKTDCRDPDCYGEVCSDEGEICIPFESYRCKCPDTGDEETSCDDGVDNDCDGKIDCADRDCSKRACDPDRPKKRCVLSTESCELPSGEANCSSGEFCCGDGDDNDGDGETDCNDTDCHGEQCASSKWCRQSSSNAEFRCQ